MHSYGVCLHLFVDVQMFSQVSECNSECCSALPWSCSYNYVKVSMKNSDFIEQNWSLSCTVNKQLHSRRNEIKWLVLFGILRSEVVPLTMFNVTKLVRRIHGGDDVWWNSLFLCMPVHVKTHSLFLTVDRLEHGWAGQLEHGCWQACSCMLEHTVHVLMMKLLKLLNWKCYGEQ